jgi:hypothetical protein
MLLLFFSSGDRSRVFLVFLSDGAEVVFFFICLSWYGPRFNCRAGKS